MSEGKESTPLAHIIGNIVIMIIQLRVYQHIMYASRSPRLIRSPISLGPSHSFARASTRSQLTTSNLNVFERAVSNVLL